MERACDIRVDKILAAVRGNVGLVQGRRMEDGIHAVHAALHLRAVDNRPDVARKG